MLSEKVFKNDSEYKILALMLLFLVIVVVPVVFVYAKDSINQAIIHEKESNAKVIFNIISHEFDDIVKQSEENLAAWAGEIESGNFEDYCDTDQTKVLDVNEYMLNYGFVELDGYARCLLRDVPEGFNFLNDVAEYPKFVEDEVFTVTNFGYSASTGLPRIGFGYPVFDEGGDFIGGVFTSLSLEGINDSIDDMGLIENSELLITDSSGAIEIIYPKDSSLLGERTFSETTLSIILSGKSGSIEALDHHGHNMLYVYEPYVLEEGGDPVSFIIYGVEYKPWRFLGRYL